MLHIHNLFATIRNLQVSPSQEKGKPKQQPIDSFEPPVLLSGKLAKQALDSTKSAISQLQWDIDRSLEVLARDSVGKPAVLQLRFTLREYRAVMDALSEKLHQGESVPNTQIINARRAVWQGEKTLAHAQVVAVAESLGNCSGRVRAHIDALAVINALKQGDLASVSRILATYRDLTPKKENRTESDLLKRFDSKLLAAFAERDLIFRMPMDFFAELEKECLEIPKLKQELKDINDDLAELNLMFEDSESATERTEIAQVAKDTEDAKYQVQSKIETLLEQKETVENAFYLREHYHVVAQTSYYGLFKRVNCLFDEAGIAIATPDANADYLFKKMFRGHFELFCGLGIIERFTYSTVREMVENQECRYQDFVKIGSDYCRIAPGGYAKIQEATLMAPRVAISSSGQERAPQVKTRAQSAPEAPKRVFDYAIGRLDQSVVLK